MNTLHINSDVPQLYRLKPVTASLWLVPFKNPDAPFIYHHRDQNNDYKSNNTCRINISSIYHRLTSSLSAPLTTIQIPIDPHQSTTPCL